MSLLVLMFGISWALAQKCRFWNYRDLNVFGISGSGLEMLILRLEAHFRHFPNHGSQILILTLSMSNFHISLALAWRCSSFANLKLRGSFSIVSGPRLDCLNSWGWPRRCSVSISSSHTFFFLFLVPKFKDVEFEALELHFHHFSDLRPTMSSFNLWSSFSAFPSPWCKHVNGVFSKLLVSLVLILFPVKHGFKNWNLDADSFCDNVILYNILAWLVSLN